MRRLIFARQFIVLALIVSYWSCEVEYEVDSSDFQSSLVVNAMMSDDTPWAVSVSESVNILETNAPVHPVSAQVEIFNREGNFLYELTKGENGLYSNGDNTPSAGQAYTIRVTADGYKVAMAQDMVPTDGELSVSKLEIINDDGTTSNELIFSIGKEDKDTYLVWDLYKKSDLAEAGISEDDRSLVNVWLGELSTSPKKLFTGKKRNVIKTFDGSVTTTLDQLVDQDGGRTITDNQINPTAEGEVNPGTTDLAAMDGEDSSEGGDGSDGDGSSSEDAEEQYELRVMTISKDLHDYYKSLEEYFRYSSSNTAAPPSMIHTNIENGYGIFGSYNEQVLTF